MIFARRSCPTCQENDAKRENISAKIREKCDEISALKKELVKKTEFCKDLLSALKENEKTITSLEIKIEKFKGILNSQSHIRSKIQPELKNRENSTEKLALTAETLPKDNENLEAKAGLRGKTQKENEARKEELRRRLEEKRKERSDRLEAERLEADKLEAERQREERIAHLEAERQRKDRSARLEAARQRKEILDHAIALGQRKKIIDACHSHFGTLQANLRRAVSINEYGALIKDDSSKEIHRFFNSLKISTSRLAPGDAEKIVLETIKKISEESESSGFAPENAPENGLDFEHWVSESLRGFGWKSSVTQGSGDQGIDVIATFEGVSVGIQCKRYSGTVGNKAVQEVFSGVKHMGLNKAAVLTNAHYTRSAQELAKSTGVLLLTSEDIPTLHKIIKG